jgi:plastocyanin
MQAGIPVQTHGRAPRKLQALLRGTRIQRERTGADEEVAQRGETSRPARAARAPQHFHGLRKSVARARQPVGADHLGKRLGKRSPARHREVKLCEIGAERRGVLPQFDELAHRHGRNWIPFKTMRRLLAFGFLCAATFCNACKDNPPPVPQTGTPGRTGTATVRGTVRFRGTVPLAPHIGRGSFAECAKTPPREKAVLVSADGGVAEAFVWIKQGVPEGDYAIPAEPVVVDQRGCEFLPRVAGVRAGQPVAFRNDDQTLHNVHAIGTGSNRFNFGMPVTGMEVKRLLTEPQVTVTIACDVHPWMRAYLGVVRHPFFAVTGADGHFAIGGLPAGTYLVEAWQEAAGRVEQSVTLRDGEAAAIELTFAP